MRGGEDLEFFWMRNIHHSGPPVPKGAGPYCQLVVGNIENSLEMGVL